jgi:uncharacterized membrane protein YbhN (UPF0104 family)
VADDELTPQELIDVGVDPTYDAPRPWTTARIIKGIVLPIVFVVLLALFVWQQRDRLDPLWNAPIYDIAVISALILVSHFLNSTEFWLLYRRQGSKSGIIENWWMFLAGLLANYMPAQAGTLYRLRYMRLVHGVSYPKSVSVYGANFVATLAGASATALIGVLGYIFVAHQDVPWVMLFLVIGLIVASVVMAIAPLPRFGGRSGRFARAWRSFHDGFETVRKEPGTALAVVALEMVKYCITAWRFLIAFHLIGVNESFWVYMVLAPATGVANFISFTPGAFGFREGFLTGAAALMGVGISAGLLGATLDRAVIIFTSVVAGAIGFAYTYPRLRAAQNAQLAASTHIPSTETSLG